MTNRDFIGTLKAYPLGTFEICAVNPDVFHPSKPSGTTCLAQKVVDVLLALVLSLLSSTST